MKRKDCRKPRGSVYDNNGYWYYDVRLPGDKKRKKYPLCAPGSDKAMRSDRPKEFAVEAAHRFWESNVVFGCEIIGVDKERHMYQIKLVAPSKMLADKTVQFIFLTYQKSLEERIEVVFQKNAAKIGDLHKREELRKLINADSLRIKMYGDVKIRKIRRFNLWCK